MTKIPEEKIKELKDKILNIGNLESIRGDIAILGITGFWKMMNMEKETLDFLEASSKFIEKLDDESEKVIKNIVTAQG